MRFRFIHTVDGGCMKSAITVVLRGVAHNPSIHPSVCWGVAFPSQAFARGPVGVLVFQLAE